jgi:hypothetical protein
MINAMSPVRHGRLATEATTALCGPAVNVSKIDADEAGRPGLYAFYASASSWRQLGLGKPPDSRPLYVGKAESTLASRDVEGHFGLRRRGVQSPTGSSTLRRSLAALLAAERGYRGVPRNPAKPGHFSNYGLTETDDDDLSAWMKRRLRLALWPHDAASDLDTVETYVLSQLQPPLNLDKVVTPWRDQVKAARRLLAAEAGAWTEH